MTNKEFFVKVLSEERSKFRKAIEALPEDKYNHKVSEISREAGNLASQLSVQWYGISGIVLNNAPNTDGFKQGAEFTKDQLLTDFDKHYDQLLEDLETVSEDNWLNDDAAMGEFWKDKKYMMAWGFLFDAIHHRGQLTTFLRDMGAKVPAIYGPSADADS